MADILVIAEHFEGKLKKGTLSVLAFAKEAADKLGGGYDIAVIGNNIGDIANALTTYGAEKVYTLDGADWGEYLAQKTAAVIAELAKSSGARLVATSASSFGKDCLPRVAVKLEAGMASDVVGFGTSGNLTYLRPMWAGNVLGEVEITTPIHVVTVRNAEFDALPEAGGSSPVEAFAPAATPADIKQKIVEFRKSVSERPDLAEAAFVVAGGRGVRSKENFELIYNLADALGAAVGATRAAVDAEFIDNDYQIGQTGKIVAPELYIGVGISGAIQHLAGMKNSKIIVAINKDEEAPIFSVADYGLVADLFKVLPELTEKIKQVKG